jgi:hypothetical protein
LELWDENPRIFELIIEGDDSGHSRG